MRPFQTILLVICGIVVAAAVPGVVFFWTTATGAPVWSSVIAASLFYYGVIALISIPLKPWEFFNPDR